MNMQAIIEIAQCGIGVGTGSPVVIDLAVSKRKSRYLQGLGFIFLQCFVWIGASLLTQYLYGEEEFHSPFLMTYTGASLLVLLLPIKYLMDRTKDCTAMPDESVLCCADSFDVDLAKATGYNDIIEIAKARTIRHATDNKEWNHKRHMLAAIQIAPAMFLTDWAFNSGLSHTSVASNTVLVSTSSVFVFLLAVFIKVEPFSYYKLAGAIFAVVGTALTAHQDAEDSTDYENNDNDKATNEILWGDMFSLIAAIGYATYTVQVRLVCPPNEELFSMQLLLGYVGVVCAVPVFPAAVYTFVTQVDVSFRVFMILVGKGFLDFVVTDYLLFRAVLLTDATTASVGLGLTIPLAILTDFLIKQASFSALTLVGALSVAIGFVMVNLAGGSSEREESSLSSVENADNSKSEALTAGVRQKENEESV